ncbi:family 20 glycosylhydrolase [Chitinophaga sp. MM2321]|uniref:family 20 glycosylhydrolase n=1 Tax=Chitinophaga sp. MM2321 TaxID=3137178 RepID=UPI0032D5782A
MKLFKKALLFLAIISVAGCAGHVADTKEKAPFRGFMIDAPRTVESPDYYFKLIDFCQQQGLNSIVFRLTDDHGSAYLFKSHPELKMTDGAFSMEELKQLVAYSDSKGVELIPEVESFGHASYILETERYKSLSDGGDGGNKEFNAVCPVSDTTLSLMKDLYTEISSIFTSSYFHIGCDEINWGGSELSKAALKTTSKHQIWANYINTLNGYVKDLGKKTIIWGDVPIYHEREVLDLIQRDVVIMDWNYWEANKATVQGIADTLISKGFQVIGSPAVYWCRWGPRIGALQMENISAYAAVYGKPTDPNNLGIIMTNWVPQRVLQGAQWDTYTIAAEMIKHQGDLNYMDPLPAFVKNHFDAEWDSTWAEIYRVAYEQAPQSFCSVNAESKFLVWSAKEDIQRIVKNNSPVINPFGEIKNKMIQYKDRVKKNQSDYDDFILAIDYLDYVYNRQNGLLTFAKAKEFDLKTTQAYLQGVAQTDRAFLSKLETAWAKGRRSGVSHIEDDKDFMMSIFEASKYSNKLSSSPAELIQLLK